MTDHDSHPDDSVPGDTRSEDTRSDDSPSDDSRLETATDPDGPLDDAETEEDFGEAGRSISRDQTRVEPPSISSTYSHPRADGDDEPDEIRGYRVLRLLGEGGMGEVFEAEQVGAVRRRVAIKVIKRGMDSRRIVNRFEAERQALAMMDHPGIARIFDAGLTEDHRPYFAMEYVEGVPITEYCDEHRLSIRRRIELFVQVCRAVQHAHLKGIIHRDLKPTNILVTLQDGEPVPKVIDFGLAKAMSEPLTEREMKTEMGQLLGTMEYMSPEQADLGSPDIDTRTDVYSLGVVLYQLLAGTLPFESKELMQGGYWRALRRIREEEAERPSRKTTTSADPEEAAEKRHLHDSKELCKRLAGDLDWIVLKAVAKDRAGRYETVNGLALDLERHLNDEPVTAASPTIRYRLGKFVRRHRMGFSASVALVALIIAFGVAMAFQAKRIAEERDRANLEAATAEESLEFMVDIFEVVDPEENRGNTITAREVLDSGAEQLKLRLDEQPLVRARLLDTIGNVYLKLGLSERAEPLIEDALEIRQRELPPSSQELAVSWQRIADLHEAQGARDQGEAAARRAVEIVRSTSGEESREMAGALRTLGWALLKQDRHEEAEPILRRALELRQKFLAPDDPEVGQSLYDVGALLYHQGKYDESETVLNRSLEIYEAKFGSSHLRVRAILNMLGGVALADGRLEDGERYFRRAAQIIESVMGAEHRRLASALNNLAVILDAQGKYEEAESMIDRSLEIYRASLGEEHEEYGTALGNLAWNSYRQNEYERAVELYEEALAIYSDTVGESHSLYATVLRDYALTLGQNGEARRALDLVDRSLAIRRDTFGEAHPAVADCYRVKGDLHRELGEYAESESALKRALSIYSEILGDDHATVDETRRVLTEVSESVSPRRRAE